MATPTVTPYGMGVRGNDSWATDERPKNWRDMILYLEPNGDAPLTAILAKLSKQSVNDPEFNWWEKTLPTQGGTVTNVYEDAGLANAYDASDDFAAGLNVYVKTAAAVMQEIRPGHQVLLRDVSDSTNDVNAKVTNVVINGANSYATCKLLEADGTGNGDLSNCDRIDVIGSINPEGGLIPQPVSYKPNKLYNYTQIFRTPLSITRTARKTRLRTGDQWREMRREALQLHSVEMEKALIYGIRTENTGDNGEPERTTWGLLDFIETNASVHNLDYTTDEDYDGQTWAAKGRDWLDESLEVIFRYGSRDRLAYCGSGALLGIQQLAQAGSQFTLDASTAAFGSKIVTWVTPFGNLHMKTHPLFSYNAADRNRMLILSPENLKERYIDQTHLKKDDSEKKAGQLGFDGTKEEFLTEMGLEIHHAFTHGILNGVGLANPS